MSATYFRLLKEHDGDFQRALQHACGAIDWYAAHISYGFIQCAPEAPVRPGKAIPPAIVDPDPAEAVEL